MPLSVQKSHESEYADIEMSGASFQVIPKYQNMIYRTAWTIVRNHADAEDILQEVFLTYFQKHPAFESESHEKAWFLRVTMNQSKNLMRSFWKSRRTEVDFENLIQPQANPREREVLQAVIRLPEKYRIAIYLYYYEGYAIKEISDLTGHSEMAVAQHLTRGRKKLRALLEGE